MDPESRLLILLGCMGATPLSRSSAALTLSEGLMPHQVLQRDANDLAMVRCEGASAAEGVIEVRVTREGVVLPGFDRQACGEARAGRWRASVIDLPTGGPYDIDFRVQGTDAPALEVPSILVGDLWVLGGQSNMQGVGDMVDIEPPSPLVHVYEHRERWALAREPLHWLHESIHPVHWDGNQEAHRAALARRPAVGKGVGPGLAFARAYVERTGVPVGLAPCAHGATSMDQWSPALKDRGGEALYGAMLARIAAVGGAVKGVLWYQGESDTWEPMPPHFRDKFAAFVPALRRDVNAPDLPFLYVQLSRFVGGEQVAPRWNMVQEAQRQLEAELPHTAMAVAVDLQLDDPIHIGTQGHKRLGRRLDALAEIMTSPDATVKRGPRPVSLIRISGGLRVAFEHVNGSLLPREHIAGFSVRDEAGNPAVPIFHARRSLDDPHSVDLLLAGEADDAHEVWYGHGLNPYCNLVDERDMAAPMFGPWRVAQ